MALLGESATRGGNLHEVMLLKVQLKVSLDARLGKARLGREASQAALLLLLQDAEDLNLDRR